MSRFTEMHGRITSEVERSAAETLKRASAAWKRFSEIEGDWTYHAAEGGESKYTEKDMNDAWKAVDDLLRNVPE